MSLFLNLLLGHLLADFVLQPGRLVVAKREGIPGLLVHVGLVGMATALVLYSELAAYWPVVVLAAGLHLVVERLTISARFHTSSRGLFVFILDQALHVLSLGLLAWLAFDGADVPVQTFGVQLTDPALAAASGVVCVAFLGSILAFETANAAILRFDVWRAAGMIERGLALAIALAVHPALGLVAFLPRAVYASTLPPERRTRQMLEASAGLALCVLAFALIAAVTLVTS